MASPCSLPTPHPLSYTWPHVFPTDPSPHLLPPSHTPLNRGLIAVAAALVVLWTAACGDGTTEPAPTPNRAPVPSGTIPALTVAAGNTATVNVASYFSDPDGDALVYTATSSNPRTATVAVSGSVVTVTANARGETTVTVTASDPAGLSAQATFAVTVPNQAPVAVDSIPAQAVFVGDTVQLDMSAHFNDPDGDALVYSAPSSNSTVVSTSVAGSVVSISAISAGTAVITVTATDPDGLAAQNSFEVTVPNRAPVSVGALPAQTLAVGQVVAVNVSPHFEDPDNDSLTYTAATTDSAVALATISDNVLTVDSAGAGDRERDRDRHRPRWFIRRAELRGDGREPGAIREGLDTLRNCRNRRNKVVVRTGSVP